MNINKYERLTDNQKKKFLEEQYHKQQLSWIVIAEDMDTYPNKLRREAKRLGVDSRNKSDAQKIALKDGRSTHPTEGKEHDERTKIMISESQGKVWDSLTDKERLIRSEKAKNAWDRRSEKDKRSIILKGSEAIRKASKEGSKLEKFILSELVNRKYRVQFHREHWLKNARLETDLYIEDLLTVIEVDGPSHFSPIWGEENLLKNQRSDLEKTALILEQGMVLIRIKQTKRSSNRYFREILNSLIEVLDRIEDKFPKESKRYIEL